MLPRPIVLGDVRLGWVYERHGVPSVRNHFCAMGPVQGVERGGGEGGFCDGGDEVGGGGGYARWGGVLRSDGGVDSRTLREGGGGSEGPDHVYGSMMRGSPYLWSDFWDDSAESWCNTGNTGGNKAEKHFVEEGLMYSGSGQDVHVNAVNSCNWDL